MDFTRKRMRLGDILVEQDVIRQQKTPESDWVSGS
jgi:hypothetical protein